MGENVCDDYLCGIKQLARQLPYLRKLCGSSIVETAHLESYSMPVLSPGKGFPALIKLRDVPPRRAFSCLRSVR